MTKQRAFEVSPHKRAPCTRRTGSGALTSVVTLPNRTSRIVEYVLTLPRVVAYCAEGRSLGLRSQYSWTGYSRERA